jgi:hypothetical protein
MTNTALPSGSSGAEGDSEKKKWGYKREQFAAVISNTRLNGVVEKLVAGTLEVSALLTVLDELGRSNLQGRYMAEMLALKQESRKIATIPFSPAVAEFLLQGSQRIPFYSEGLASQMAVTLAAAADNSEYLDTVNTAIGRLLFNLDRPLKPDTRNYLRALTDKIDASRRLQQARSQLSTVPSVYPPSLSEPTSALIAAGTEDANIAQPSESVAQPNENVAEHLSAPVADERVETVSSDLSSSVEPPHRRAAAEVVAMPSAQEGSVTEGFAEAAPSYVSAPLPSKSKPTIPGLGTLVLPSALSESAFEQASAGATAAVESESFHIPKRSLRWLWVLVLLAAVTALAVGVYAYLRTTRGTVGTDASTRPSANRTPPVTSQGVETANVRRDRHRSMAHASPAASALTARSTSGASSVATARSVSSEKPVPTEKNATLAEVRAKSGESASKHPAPLNPSTTKPVESKPVESKPVESKPVESKPVESKPSSAQTVTNVPRTPTPTTDIDQILDGLRRVPNDVARIEATAHDVSRIVARSAKAEAEKILARMTPEELLFGMENYDTRALEPLRRVVALTLQKVAVDKDDGRAAQAVEMLGQWAKSRKHGGAAKLTLDQLAEEPVILSRSKRRQALERVRQRLGLTQEQTD